MSWQLLLNITSRAVSSAGKSSYPSVLTPFTSWTREGTTAAPPTARSDGESHSWFEMAYVNKGSCRMLLGDKNFVLSPGDYCLIPPRHCHSEGTLGLESRYQLLWFVFASTDVGLFVSEFRGGEAGFFTHLGLWINVGATLQDALERILLEERNNNVYREAIIQSQLLHLTGLVARRVHLMANQDANPFPATRGVLVQEVERFVLQHYADPELRVADMAKHVSLSSNHFSDHFRRETGQSPYKYLLATRLSLACKMLVNSADSVAVIAEKVGFRAPHHFSRVFKQFYGVSPTSYRSSCKLAVRQQSTPEPISAR